MLCQNRYIYHPSSLLLFLCLIPVVSGCSQASYKKISSYKLFLQELVSKMYLSLSSTLYSSSSVIPNPTAAEAYPTQHPQEKNSHHHLVPPKHPCPASLDLVAYRCDRTVQVITFYPSNNRALISAHTGEVISGQSCAALG